MSHPAVAHQIQGWVGLLLLLNITRQWRRLGGDTGPVPVVVESVTGDFPLHRISTLIYFMKA